MTAAITLKGIDKAIENLRYRNRNSSKFRLLQAIRAYYRDEHSLETIREIDSDELIRTLWAVGDNPTKLKHRRKNLSSLRSSINADLIRIYHENKNPEGIIIGPSNTFIMSDEAKDSALEALKYGAEKGGGASLQELLEVLGSVKELLSRRDVLLESDAQQEAAGFKELRDLVRELSERVGLEILGNGPAEGEEGQGRGAYGEGIQDDRSGEGVPGTGKMIGGGGSLEGHEGGQEEGSHEDVVNRGKPTVLAEDEVEELGEEDGLEAAEEEDIEEAELEDEAVEEEVEGEVEEVDELAEDELEEVDEGELDEVAEEVEEVDEVAEDEALDEALEVTEDDEPEEVEEIEEGELELMRLKMESLP
ncbi:MAG: hypothetical protein JRF57_13275 [Deltaproteobacteria bacterium]|nr:hypothetical protein [Deltaproteobacteria bacterium]